MTFWSREQPAGGQGTHPAAVYWYPSLLYFVFFHVELSRVNILHASFTYAECDMALVLHKQGDSVANCLFGRGCHSNAGPPAMSQITRA